MSSLERQDQIMGSGTIHGFKKIVHSTSMFFENVGIWVFLFMIGIMCVDALSTKVFSSPIVGTIDLVRLSQLVGIGFAIASAQVLGKHVAVDFLINKAPHRMQAVVGCLVNLILFAFFCLIVWRLFRLGYAFQIAQEATETLYIPIYPFVYAVAFLNIPVCLLFLIEFLETLPRLVKR